MPNNDVTSTSPALILAVLASLTLPVLLTARPYRLRSAIVGMCLVMTISRLHDLGAIAITAKITSGWSLLMIALAAHTHPGPRRCVTVWNLLAIPVAVLGCLVVTGAEDWIKALAFRAQAAVAVIAAICVARTITDNHSLREPLIGLAIGTGFGVAITLSCLVVDPWGAYAGGYGRLQPYGCNPVQIGVLYLVGAVLGLFFTVERHPSLPAWLAAGFATLSILGATLTVSRMAIGGIVIASLPSLVRLIRKPFFATVIAVVVLILIPRLFSTLGDANLEHLDASRDSHRLLFMGEVFSEVCERPWLGLLTADGLSAHDGEFNAHNAYLELLFLGGMVYAIPSMLLMLIAAWGAARTIWQPRLRLGGSALLTTTLALFYWLSLANGCVTFINNYPTFIISIVQCLLVQHYLIVAMTKVPLAREPLRTRPGVETPWITRTNRQAGSRQSRSPRPRSSHPPHGLSTR